MRKVVVLSFMSLDDVIQAPVGPEEDTSGSFKFGGWSFPYFDEFSGKVMGEQMSNNTVFLKDNVEDQIKKLKQQKGPDLQVHGSGNFIQTLLKNDLVDEFWLKIFPVTLGNGKRLFENGTIPARFSLLEYKVSPGGVLFANYERDGEVKTGSFV